MQLASQTKRLDQQFSIRFTDIATGTTFSPNPTLACYIGIIFWKDFLQKILKNGIVYSEGILMAKKGTRQFISFVCTVCKSRNYTSEKNTYKTKQALLLNKFCSQCRKTTEHKDAKL